MILTEIFMRLSTDLDVLDELKEPLPAGTYVLEYVRDGFSNNNTIIDIFCKVVKCDEHPETVGKECKIQTCYSSDNKRVVAIGNSIRNQIFRACIGKELFEAESNNGGINTVKLYGLQFQCYIDVKETSFGFSLNKNSFKSFKLIYSDEELLQIAKDRFQ